MFKISQKRNSDANGIEITKNNRSSNNIVGIEHIGEGRRIVHRGHSSTNKMAQVFGFSDNTRIRSAHSKAQSMVSTRNVEKLLYSVTSNSIANEVEKPSTQTATLYGILQKNRTGKAPNLNLYT